MKPEKRKDLNHLLDRVTRDHTDSLARDELYELLYDDMKRKARYLMSQERIDHTLGPTDLVHNAYFKLIDFDSLPEGGRAYFLAAAGRAMRQVLIDHARGKNTGKRGGGWQKVDLSHVGSLDFPDPVAGLAMADALKDLSCMDERAANVMTLRFFSDLTMAEIGEALGVTRQTVYNDYRVAVSWLRARLQEAENA